MEKRAPPARNGSNEKRPEDDAIPVAIPVNIVIIIPEGIMWKRVERELNRKAAANRAIIPRSIPTIMAANIFHAGPVMSDTRRTVAMAMKREVK